MNKPLDYFEELASHNPFPSNRAIDPELKDRFDRNFKEITMTAIDTRPTKGKHKNPSPSRNGKVWTLRLLTGFCAVAALAVAISVIDSGSNSAAAAVAESAERTAEHTSGHVRLVAEIGGQERYSLNYRFDGSDFEQSQTYDDETLGLVGIDGLVYVQSLYANDLDLENLDVGWCVTTPEVAEGTGAYFDGWFQPSKVSPESLLPIIERSEDFARTAGEGDTAVYTGTVDKNELRSLDSDDLGPGLEAVVHADDADFDLMNDDIVIQFSTVAGELSEVRLDVSDEDGGVAYVTTYNSMGQAQEIVAPADLNTLSSCPE